MDLYKSQKSSSNSNHGSRTLSSSEGSPNEGNTFSLQCSGSTIQSSSPSSLSSACIMLPPISSTSSLPTPPSTGLLPGLESGNTIVPDVVVATFAEDSTPLQSALAMSVVSSSTALSHRGRKLKRKRHSSTNNEDKEDEHCLEPVAKRQQKLVNLYKNHQSSVMGPMPIPYSDALPADGDEHSSSESYIPDSPSSLQAIVGEDESDVDRLSFGGDEYKVEAKEIFESDTDDLSESGEIDVVSTSSLMTTGIPKEASHSDYVYMQLPHQGECTPSQRCSSSYHTLNTNIKVNKFIDEQSSCSYVKPHDEQPHNDCLESVKESEVPRQCPLPALSWANAYDVWQLMCKKDDQASNLRSESSLDRHPGLNSRMRAILLDWLIEVCEVYKLHRETYYLAVDYLDRYLYAHVNIQKTHLQLIGITCLFVAAKVEEIYPPKINEFAYVTDGACQESEILQHEILVLQALGWSISPVTPIGWLGVYMQLNVNNRTPASFNTNNAKYSNQKEQISNKSADNLISKCDEVDEAFIYPQFSAMEFVKAARLLDLCSLDIAMGKFSYSVLAAAAISHTFNKETAIRCSGLEWKKIQPCSLWMEAFYEVISKEHPHIQLPEQNEQVASKFGLGHICPKIVTDDSHIIQTHSTSMELFDQVFLIQDQLIRTKIKQEASPAAALISHDGLLTPPASDRKPPGVTD